MEFTFDLLSIQGVLTSAENRCDRTPMSEIYERDGNEAEISFITQELLKVMEQLGYFDKDYAMVIHNKNKIREAVFYILLNTKLSVIKSLSETAELGSIASTLTNNITPFLMCEIFTSLELDEFMSEIIAYSSPSLSVEVMGYFLNFMKNLDYIQYLNKLPWLLTSCYRQIIRQNFSAYDNLDNLEIMLDLSFNCFLQCLNYYTDHTQAKNLNPNEDKQHEFIGMQFINLLRSTLKCIEMFNDKLSKHLKPRTINVNIYDYTYINKESLNYNMPTDIKISDSPNKNVLDCLASCNCVLMDKCKESIMSVSVETFCAWSEFTEFGKQYHLQESIRRVCTNLYRVIRGTKSLSEHSILAMLETFICKPDIELDELTEVEMEIASSSDEEKHDLLCSLISKPNVCDNINLLKLLDLNLQFLNQKDLDFFYDILDHFLIERSINDDFKNNENINYYIELSIKIFQQCSISSKHRILEKHFSLKHFFDSLIEDSKFDRMMTEIFNKLIISPDADVSDILTVFLLRPLRVYTRIFEIAAENAQQSDIMLKVMSFIKSFSTHFYETDVDPCIVKVAKSMLQIVSNKPKKDIHLILFLRSLKNDGIIAGMRLLILIVMPVLHDALLSKNFNCMFFALELLRLSYSIQEMTVCKAPILAMLAQVLEVARWTMCVFTTATPAPLVAALQLQNCLISTYKDNCSDSEKEIIWLRDNLKDLSPINKYHYRLLWNIRNDNIIQFITQCKLHSDMSPKQVLSTVLNILIRSTYDEWILIWNAMCPVFGEVRSLQHLNLAMCVIAGYVTKDSNTKNNSDIWSCILYCFQNLVSIIRYRFFRTPLMDIQVAAALQVIVMIASICEERSSELAALFMPLLAFLAERKSEYSLNAADYLRNQVKTSGFLNVINQIFPADVTVAMSGKQNLKISTHFQALNKFGV